jgi:signal transduction histidine kinase
MTVREQVTYSPSMSTSDVTRRPAPDRLGLVLRGWLPDATLALVVGAAQVLATYFAAQGQPDQRPLDVTAFVLLVVGPVALVARRRHVVAVLVVVLATTLLYFALGYPDGPAWLALVVALVTAVTEGHRLAAWLAAAVVYVSNFGLGYLLGLGSPPSLLQAVAVAAWALVVLVVAEVVRVRRERAMEAARTREEEARRRASEERLGIARELHDVLAHHISLINVQAGVALYLLDEQPEQARSALAAIKQVSKDVLGELRVVLDMLRQVDETPPRSPAPGLARLDPLVLRAAAAGLTVRTTVEGAPRPLPASVDLAAFRIVQEALTNVARHAGQATATVRVAYGERDLTLQVDDDGHSTMSHGTSGGGNGIRGMRERAAALGGQFAAGPRPGGGFRVLARLPTNGA